MSAPKRDEEPAEPFPCTKCGQCCKVVKQLIPDWEHVDPETGYCSYLAPDNTCSIYFSRPGLCRIHTAYDILHLKEKLGISRLGWYKMNANHCNMEQIKAGVPKLYRIDVGAIK